jgi:hypothetical protein
MIIALLCLLLTSPVFAEVTFHNTNQATLEWTAVTTDIDGDPITGVTYRIYFANADTDPTKTNPVIVAETADTSVTVTVGTKGRYFAGAQAVLGDLVSEINWADVESVYQEGIDPWGIRFAVPPKTPPGFNKQ